MKSITRFFLPFLVLLVTAIFCLYFVTSSVMASVLGSKLGVPVKIGSFHLNLVGSQVTFHDVLVRNPPGFSNGTLLRFSRLFLDLEPSSLRRKELHFKEIEIDCREIHVVRSPEGRQNWLELKPLQGDPKESRGVRDLNEKGAWTFRVDRFNLELGRATYADFSRPVPLRRQYTLDIERVAYADVRSLKNMLGILCWEAISDIRLLEPPDTFTSIVGKVESRLGSRAEVLRGRIGP